MRNKYNNGELILVDGKGKIYNTKFKGLGFIIEKDFYYDDYYIEMISGKKDWFKEKNIKRVLGTKRNKSERHQIRLCTTKEGYEIIMNNIKEKEPVSNNKLEKVTIYKKFIVDNNYYIVLGWNSVFWPVSNESVKIIEGTLKRFKKLNIPFQYIVINEEDVRDISIIEFSDNDKNVNIFSVERKIKLKKGLPLK